MQNRHVVPVIVVGLIVLAALLFVAASKGIVYFSPGSLVPRFSMAALTNPRPSLDRDITYPSDFTEEAKVLHKTKVANIKSILEKDPLSHEAWLDLAIYYRMVQDNEGALEIWNYVRKLYPEDGISRHNLAEYYFHDKKDYPKAEALYRESIEVAPALASNYSDLYDMYRYVYKQDTTAAVDILKEAIEKLGSPASIQFKIILGRHYRDVLADRENAGIYLTQARDEARNRGDTGIANQLTAELRSL